MADEKFQLDVSRSLGRFTKDTSEKESDIVFCHMKCNEKEVGQEQHEQQQQSSCNCIFAIDLSGSMSPSVRMLRSSLRAFRDVIIGSTHDSTLTQKEKDDQFRKSFNFQLIGFSDTASILYDTKDNATDNTNDNTLLFDDAIEKYVVASGYTNIYDALDLAFSRVPDGAPTIICLLSDGEPNRGKLQNTESLGEYVSSQKDDRMVSLLSIGFGDNIKTDLLEAIGSFSYIESDESIPQVFGSVASQTQTSFGWNARIRLISDSGEVVEMKDDAIVGGEGEIGNLYCGRTFSFAISAENIPANHSLELVYYDINEKETIKRTISIPTNPVDGHDDKLIDAYYNTKKANMLDDLRRCNRQKEKAAEILEEISRWDGVPEAVEHIEELSRIAKNVLEYGGMTRSARNLITSSALECVHQTYTTHSRGLASVTTSRYAKSCGLNTNGYMCSK